MPDRYRKTASLRNSLRARIRVSVFAYLGVLALSVFAYFYWSIWLYNPVFLLATLTPVLGDHAAHKSKYYLLLAYSTITALAAAFVLAFGFGHAFNKLIMTAAFDLWNIFILSVNAGLFGVLMSCVLQARALLPFFKFELNHFKKN